MKLPNCYSKVVVKLKSGEVINGRVEYVNKSRSFFNHISVREHGSKHIENLDLENDVESWSYAKKNDECDDEEEFVGHYDITDGPIPFFSREGNFKKEFLMV